jgi:acetyltransferase
MRPAMMPVLVVKAGRSALGQAAAASHTGALAGSDIVFDAAIRRAGMLRVDTLQELFVAAETLAHFRGLQRSEDSEALEQLTILTNGGGAGVMAADAAAAAGVALAPLADDTLHALDAVLPATGRAPTRWTSSATRRCSATSTPCACCRPTNAAARCC